MVGTERRYTPAEAATLGGLAVKSVNNAIDKRIIDLPQRAAMRRGRRSLSTQDVLRLKLWHEVGPILSAERRQRLFSEIERRPTAKRVKADRLVIVDVEEARREIARKARDLAAAEAIVTRNRAVLGGEPIFAGTRVPVRLVADLLDQGTSESEILDGYPSLEPGYLPLARIWAAANPRRGRPKNPADQGMRLRSRSQAPLRPDPGVRTAS